MANEHPVLPADMVLPTGLYFLALVPPLELQANIRGLQHRMAEEFGSKRALRSPPHITLQPPFSSTAHRIQALTQALAPWCAQRSGVDLSLRDFAAFAPRVVYIAVEHQPTLTTLQQALTQDFQAYFHGEPSAIDRQIPKPILLYPTSRSGFGICRSIAFGTLGPISKPKPFGPSLSPPI